MARDALAALDHMPHLKALGQAGSRAPLGTVLPAVTCAA
ncbi:alkaline phosphatase family protein, partial [Streptomyces sp. SID10244]|nr:alkaline phosphatase family protein [Streptomyces sp. SID10244]